MILEQDSPDAMQRTKRTLKQCRPSVALPLLAVCSGHLLDDHEHTGTPNNEAACEHDYCHRCAEHMAIDRPMITDRERAWLHIWHTLVQCPGDTARRQALEEYESALINIATPDSTHHAALTALFAELKGAEPKDAVKQRFFALITNPAGFANPTDAQCKALVIATSRFLDAPCRSSTLDARMLIPRTDISDSEDDLVSSGCSSPGGGSISGRAAGVDRNAERQAPWLNAGPQMIHATDEQAIPTQRVVVRTKRRYARARRMDIEESDDEIVLRSAGCVHDNVRGVPPPLVPPPQRTRVLRWVLRSMPSGDMIPNV